METSVNIVNNVTDKPEDAKFKGGLQCVSMVLRDAGTPRANGKLALENRVRKRPKMELCGVREGVMEDISNPLANLLQAFVPEAEKTYDVHVVPHGQEPPTQKFSRSRKRNKTRPIHEMNAELLGCSRCKWIDPRRHPFLGHLLVRPPAL
jgi:hypothetical protein